MWICIRKLYYEVFEILYVTVVEWYEEKMMFCENCGKEIKENERFCQNCGQKIEVNEEKLQHKIQTNFASKETKTKKKWIGLAIVALVIIVAIGIFQCGSEEKLLRFNLQVVNNTGIDIYALYASEPNVDNWEEDLLRDNILYDGERFNIEFLITEDNLDWDFAIEDVNGSILEFYGLNFANCDVNGATLVLEYDGYEGTATLY